MNKKILIIEDNAEIQAILSNSLHATYDILSAFSGTEGLLLLDTHTVDLVLLDLMLPGKSGENVLQEIRQKSLVPVIIISALGNKQKISACLLDGANDYITKPFDLDELSARVVVQLRTRSTQVNNMMMTYKNITLNTDDFSVLSADSSVRLSRIEFELLLTLIKNPQKIFTKEELYQQIWHESYLSGDNTINTHLSNLRKKLATLDATTEYIETLWGLGVRMVKV